MPTRRRAEFTPAPGRASPPAVDAPQQIRLPAPPTPRRHPTPQLAITNICGRIRAAVRVGHMRSFRWPHIRIKTVHAGSADTRGASTRLDSGPPAPWRRGPEAPPGELGPSAQATPPSAATGGARRGGRPPPRKTSVVAVPPPPRTPHTRGHPPPQSRTRSDDGGVSNSPTVSPDRDVKWGAGRRGGGAVRPEGGPTTRSGANQGKGTGCCPPRAWSAPGPPHAWRGRAVRPRLGPARTWGATPPLGRAENPGRGHSGRRCAPHRFPELTRAPPSPIPTPHRSAGAPPGALPGCVQ
jgi:hypothetical protein